MAIYTLTVSTNDLGLGVINGARVVVERKRTLVTDIFNGRSLSRNNAATNSLGVATMLLEPDDGSVYHELKIFDLAGIPVYSKIFTMPPQAVAVAALPVQDIISESASQAVAASATATAQAVIATEAAAEAEATVGASSNIQILNWAYVQSFAITSATRNSNDVITTASIIWPDGATGTFTTDTINTTYNAIDAWHATHILDAVTKTVTQTAVTRNSNGAVTAQPVITIS